MRGALQAAAVPDAAWAELMLENINNNSRAALLSGWRGVLQALGVAAPEEARLVAQAEQLRGRFGAADPAPQWQGCYRDSREARLFSEGPRAFGHSSQACAAACTGHRYFALQGGGQCFCGRTLGRRTNHSKLPDAKCGQVCPAEEGKEPPRLCGAGWRNAVYAESRAAAASAELLLPPPPPPPPPPSRRAKANASTPSPSHHARSKHRAPLTSHGGHASAASHHKHTSSTSRHNHKHTASTSSPSRGIGTLRH